MTNELTYWYSLAMMRGIPTWRKNEIYAKCYMHNPRISIAELLEYEVLWPGLGLNNGEIQIFRQTKSAIPSNAFAVENLLSQGYDIIPLDRNEYPATLKKNMKMGSPVVIYTKGEIRLLNEPAVAIVGARNAGNISLKFTDNVAYRATSEGNIVVSGFAKGVDREALDAALASGGKSIIVLPQGITTFYSGFRQYYQPIQEGRVLVMSVFEPQAGWNAGLAMARNSIIYGMADKIYVAESGESGGTWQGVLDGLKKQREIFVRQPEESEKNANNALIQKGAVPVDINGEEVEAVIAAGLFDIVSEPENEKYESSMDSKIKELLLRGKRSSKEILMFLKSDWSDARMKTYLRSLTFISELKEKNRVYFCLKGQETQGELDLTS